MKLAAIHHESTYEPGWFARFSDWFFKGGERPKGN